MTQRPSKISSTNVTTPPIVDDEPLVDYLLGGRVGAHDGLRPSVRIVQLPDCIQGGVVHYGFISESTPESRARIDKLIDDLIKKQDTN